MTSGSLVAVVDDDPRVLESIEDLLESAGHAVASFSSAQALLLSPELPNVVCLVSDIAMPGMDGFELRARVQSLRPWLPVILVTGHELDARSLARAQSGQGFLIKPFEGAVLLAAVTCALAGDPS